jgi:hypothetical protein
VWDKPKKNNILEGRGKKSDFGPKEILFLKSKNYIIP